MRATRWTCDGCGLIDDSDPISRFEVDLPPGWHFWSVTIEKLARSADDGEWRVTHTKIRNLEICAVCSARLEDYELLPGRQFKTWGPS